MKQQKQPKAKSQENDNIEYILCNVDNYNPIIKNTISDILNKFVSINIEYLRFVSEKITIKNRLYYKFIIERGIETISHIFMLIFSFMFIFHACSSFYLLFDIHSIAWW